MAQKKKTYTPMPEIPAEILERLRVVMDVQAGVITVSDGARRLEMDRNHFQTLMHRGLQGMIDGLTPGKPGRPGKPAREVELEAENASLKKELAKLEAQSAMIQRLLGVTGELLKGQTKARKREPSAKKKTSSDPDESEIAAPMVTAMRDARIPIQIIASAIGVSESTVRRRLRDNGERRARKRAPTDDESVRIAERVRATRGQIGAASLAKAVHVSRRVAADVKHETCTAMERERLATCASVTVTTPGVVRGFDQLYIWTDRGRAFLLPMADAAVPFRTSCMFAFRYDEDAVLAAIERDFDINGVPLVLRLDRAAHHRTPRVRALLARHGVLALHGPAHHPRFYGQLERQNREHRAYFGHAETVPMHDVERRRDAMLDALNRLWLRRALGWKTPNDIWTARPELRENRDVLRREVDGWASRWHENGLKKDTAMRLAVERALTERGYLNVERGSAC